MLASLRPLAALEQQNGHLAQVEVDEVARLVRHIRPEVSPHNAVPCRVVLLIKLLLDECCYILQSKTIIPCQLYKIFN